MKLLFDQNLWFRLVAQVAAVGPATVRVRDIGMAPADDHDVWDVAAGRHFMIVSKDADVQQRALLVGAPPKIIWLRLGNCSTEAIAALRLARRADVQAFEADTDAAFLVLV